MFATVKESLEYADRIRDLFGSSIIAYNPIWEGGGDKAYDISGHGCHGIRSNVGVAPGMGDGRFSGSFNGSTSFVNWYSPALAAAFNGAEGTLMVWARVANAGVWTDNTQRWLAQMRVDGNNVVRLWKFTDNQLYGTYIAGATSKQVGVATTATTFINFSITWSKSGDKVAIYYNGVQQGATQTGLGVWAGSLNSTQCVIGSDTTIPSNVWNGLLAHGVLLNRAASAAEIAEAYRMAF